MSTAPRVFRKVGVLGLGLMGSGIAQVTAAAGVAVVGFDSSASQASKASASIAKSLSQLAAKAVKKGAMDQAAADAHVASSLSRLSTSSDRGALADCDLVIEAAPEDWEFKARLYRELRTQLRGDAALASNTSGLLIADLAREFGDPSRVLGAFSSPRANAAPRRPTPLPPPTRAPPYHPRHALL